MASEIDAGNNLTINTVVDEDGNVSLIESGNVSIIGSELTAGEDMTVGAGGTIDILSGIEESGSYSKKTKSGFLGIKKSGKEDLETTASHVGSTLEAGNDLLILAGDDLNFRASSVQAGNDVGLEAGVLDNTGSINLFAGTDTTSEEHSSYSTSLSLSISDGLKYSAEQSREATLTNTNVASNVVAAGNAALDAAEDINIIGSVVDAGGTVSLNAGGNITLINGTDYQETSVMTQESSVSLFSPKDSAIVLLATGIATETISGEKFTDDHVITDQTAVPTVISGNEGVVINAGGDFTDVGSQITAADGDLTISAAGNINILAAQDVFIDTQKEDTTEFSLVDPRIDGYKETGKTTTNTVVTNLPSTYIAENVTIVGGGDVTLHATQIIADDQITLISAGELTLATATDVTSVVTTESRDSIGWFSVRDRGTIDEAVLGVSLQSATNQIQLLGAEGIVIEFREGEEGESVREVIEQLSAESEELAWMAALLDNDDIDWQAVAEAHEEWDFEAEGLTQVAALVIVIIVTIFTYGAGTAAASGAAGGGASGFAGAVGLQAGTVATAVNAGAATLFSQAAIATINAKGDLGEALQTLKDNDVLQNVAISVITAGILEKLGSQFEGIETLQQADPGTLAHLQQTLYESAVNAVVRSTIDGSSVGDALEDQLVSGLVNFIGQSLTYNVGEIDLPDGNAIRAIAHAIVGCATAAGLGQDCGSGATGAALAELLSPLLGVDFFADGDTEDVFDDLLLTLAGTVVAGVAHQDVDTILLTATQVIEYNHDLHPDAERLLDEGLAAIQAEGQYEDLTTEELVAAVQWLADAYESTDTDVYESKEDWLAAGELLSEEAISFINNEIALPILRDQLITLDANELNTLETIDNVLLAIDLVTGGVGLIRNAPEILKFISKLVGRNADDAGEIAVRQGNIPPDNIVDDLPSSPTPLRGVGADVVDVDLPPGFIRAADVDGNIIVLRPNGQPYNVTNYIDGVRVVDVRTGRVYTGTVDLNPTLNRIDVGGSFPHRNDGSIFKNNEGGLPSKPAGYYTEYVHPTPGIDGPGPQRIITGKNGELYYSPDHYDTFVRLDY